MDPLELRLKNAAKEGTKAAYGPTFRKIGYEETLQAALEHPHYKAPLGPATRGAASPAASGSTPAAKSSAQVNVNEDGTVVVDHRPSRHRRLARLDRQYRGRAAGHRLPQVSGR